MTIIKENVFGGPEIGVYLALNNQYFIHPPKIQPKWLDHVKRINPEAISIETFIGGTAVTGSLVAMNSFGMVVPSTIKDDELEILKNAMKSDFQITVVESEHNAFGNLILCNDHGAIISSRLVDAQEAIAAALKVPVKVLDFAGTDLPGSCGLANNKGVVVHPMITDGDAEIIADFLKVEIDVSTVNTGIPYPNSGVIVNDFGGIFGQSCTGPEMQRINEILELD